MQGPTLERTEATDLYTLIAKLAVALGLKFQAIAQGQVQRVLLNGKAVGWKNVADAVGKPVIEISAPATSKLSSAFYGRELNRFCQQRKKRM